MSKSYRPWNSNQQYLLPPSVQDWLPKNDLVCLFFSVLAPSDYHPQLLFQHLENAERADPQLDNGRSMAEVRQNIDDEPPNLHFCDYFG